MRISIEPSSITDITQRLRIIVNKSCVDVLTVNGVDTPFFSKSLPNHRTIVMFFIEPDAILIGKVSIEVTAGGMSIASDVKIDASAIKEAKMLVEIREAKKEWLKNHTCCPECGTKLSFSKGRVCCNNNHIFAQPFHCLNLLSREISDKAKLAGGEFVSRHALSKIAFEIIDYAQKCGGMVLDFGAGLKFVNDYHPSVINLEIEPYPTTDIVAAGQRLPFPDNSFEGVFSFAVLEHVSDPFQCAREIARVLKPGGKVCIGVPFVFHEHGYPEHYYNMTRRGVANLFEDYLEVTAQRPGKLCIPSLLKAYHSNLSKDAAAEFEKISIGDIVNAPLPHALAMAQEATLSEEIRWRFAHGTYLWGTKKA